MSALNDALLKAYGCEAAAACRTSSGASVVENSISQLTPAETPPPTGELDVSGGGALVVECQITAPLVPASNETSPWFIVHTGGHTELPGISGGPHFGGVADTSDASPVEHQPRPPAADARLRDLPTLDGAAADRFNPQWEVDCLSWPKTCETLQQQCGDRFAKIAEGLLAAARRGRKIVAVTGIVRGEGRTTMTLCLARQMAAMNVPVALIDGDFENPQLDLRLGIDVSSGWEEVLAGQLPLEEVAIASLSDNLTILPLGQPMAVPEEESIRRRIAATLARLAAHYEMILIDSGPYEGLLCGRRGMSVDNVIVVRDGCGTQPDQLSATLERLRCDGVAVVGVAENFVPAKSGP